jgi:glyoxylase-like metal-dependent hydrolase (beta-lactamase superfamily II)
MPEIKHGVHLIAGLTHPFPSVGMVSYLTLIDTCFSADLPKLEGYLQNASYEMDDIDRIVITHLHPDHAQAVKEIKKRSG